MFVVSRNADSRYYVRECLRARPAIRVLEATTRAFAEPLARQLAPDLLIVDSADDATLSYAPAIVLADERPPGEQNTVVGGAIRVWLQRPLNAASLLTLVDRMLS